MKAKILQITVMALIIVGWIVPGSAQYNPQPVWEDAYHGGGNDRALDVVTLPDGGFAQVGWKYWEWPVGSNIWVIGAFIRVVNDDGTERWSAPMGNLNGAGGAGVFRDVIVNNHGNIVTVGTVHPHSTPDDQLYIAEFDPCSSIPVREEHFLHPFGPGFGFLHLRGKSIAQDPISGNYLVCAGAQRGESGGGSLEVEFSVVLNLDANLIYYGAWETVNVQGNTPWIPPGNYSLSHVVYTPGGPGGILPGFIVSGYVYNGTSPSTEDIIVNKFNIGVPGTSSPTPMWTSPLFLTQAALTAQGSPNDYNQVDASTSPTHPGGVDNDNERADYVSLTPNGDIIVSGLFNLVTPGTDRDGDGVLIQITEVPGNGVPPPTGPFANYNIAHFSGTDFWFKTEWNAFTNRYISIGSTNDYGSEKQYVVVTDATGVGGLNNANVTIPGVQVGSNQSVYPSPSNGFGITTIPNSQCIAICGTNFYESQNATVSLLCDAGSQPPSILEVSNLSICEGSSVTFTINSISGWAVLREDFNGTQRDLYYGPLPTSPVLVTDFVAGLHHVCLIVWGAEPEDSSDYCVEECVDVLVTQCCSLAITKTHQDQCGPGILGSIDITVTGGTAPYTYFWSDFGPTTPSRTGLTANTYIVTATDMNQCSATASITIMANIPPTVTITPSEGCPNGILIANPSPTEPGIIYAWTGPVTGNLQSLPVNISGLYSVMITYPNGCKATTSIMWTSSGFTLTGTVTDPCYKNSGSIDLIVMGDPGPYSYLWSNGATSEDVIALPPATYTVVVTDNPSGCTASASFTITQAIQPVITATTTHTCSLTNTLGTIDVTVTGGTLPYYYLWYDGSITEDRTGLSAGTYMVEVTDGSGCSQDIMVVVTECCEVECCNVEITMSDHEVCVGQEATLEVDGGGAPWGVLAIKDMNGQVLKLGGPFPLPFNPDAEPGTIDGEFMGTFQFCVYGYQDEHKPDEIEEGSTDIPPFSCDEDCETITVEMCHGESGCPDVTLDINHTALVGTTYTFFNDYESPPITDLNLNGGDGSWDPMPSWINWSVNGQVEGQTTATGSFDFEFEEGTHVVCMQAAYLVEHGDHTICCYYDDCEVIHVRGCELWKAGADFTITYGNDYHDVTVDYTGDFTGDDTWDMIIIWNFGDGTVVVSHGDDDVPTHHYDDDYTGQICAQIIWSIGPWDGSNPESCCCVTEICKDADVTPCQNFELQIVATTTTPPSITYAIVPTPPTTVTWSVNSQSVNTFGSVYTYNYIGQPCNGCVCANFLLPGENTLFPCHVCNTTEGLIENSRVIGYYPNPTNGTTTVELEAIAGEQALIEIFDFTGRFILSKSFANLSYGKNQLPINLAALSNGMYQMRVIIGGETKVVKVVKH